MPGSTRLGTRRPGARTLGRSSSMPNHWGNSSSLMDSDRLSADAPNRTRPFLLYVPQGGQHAHLPGERTARACFVTVLCWLIVSPMSEAGSAQRPALYATPYEGFSR